MMLAPTFPSHAGSKHKKLDGGSMRLHSGNNRMVELGENHTPIERQSF